MYCCPDFGCRKTAGGVNIVCNQVIGGDVFGNTGKPEEESQDVEVVIPDTMKDSMVVLE